MTATGSDAKMDPFNHEQPRAIRKKQPRLMWEYVSHISSPTFEHWARSCQQTLTETFFYLEYFSHNKTISSNFHCQCVKLLRTIQILILCSKLNKVQIKIENYKMFCIDKSYLTINWRNVIDERGAVCRSILSQHVRVQKFLYF